MAKPYSNDLRERAVAAVLKGGLSRHRAAAQFGLGVSTVIRWVRRVEETGSVSPGQMGGHKPRAIRGEYEVWLRDRIGKKAFTLRGLKAGSRPSGCPGRSGQQRKPKHCGKPPGPGPHHCSPSPHRGDYCEINQHILPGSAPIVTASLRQICPPPPSRQGDYGRLYVLDGLSPNILPMPNRTSNSTTIKTPSTVALSIIESAM